MSLSTQTLKIPALINSNEVRKPDGSGCRHIGLKWKVDCGKREKGKFPHLFWFNYLEKVLLNSLLEKFEASYEVWWIFYVPLPKAVDEGVKLDKFWLFFLPSS